MYLYKSTLIRINNQLGKEVKEEKTRFATQWNASVCAGAVTQGRGQLFIPKGNSTKRHHMRDRNFPRGGGPACPQAGDKGDPRNEKLQG